MISSLGQLLDTMGVERLIFDMGRHVQEISPATFAQFESQAIPYPSPYLQAAWFGLIFWAPESPEQPVLWFIKLPLDEQGKLLQSERDRFISQLLIGAGNNLKAAREGNQFEEVLKDNPFVFTPAPEKQACVNARSRRHLNLGGSQHQQAALDYFRGDLEQWQELPLQGLADISCDWRSHEQLLSQTIAQLPLQPLSSLCQLLENESINDTLSQPLVARLTPLLQPTMTDPQKAEATALLRGLSQASDMLTRQTLIQQALNSQLRQEAEFLATIASRCHLDLFAPEVCREFLEALAEQEQAVFNTLLQELLFIPLLRPQLINALENQNLSEKAKQAFAEFTALIRRNLH